MWQLYLLNFSQFKLNQWLKPRTSLSATVLAAEWQTRQNVNNLSVVGILCAVTLRSFDAWELGLFQLCCDIPIKALLRLQKLWLFSDVLKQTNKQIKKNTPNQPNKKPGGLKSDWKGCIREKSGWLWSRLVRKKCKQDCPNISASAVEAAAGNAQNKHIATTIGSLRDLLLAPADVSENQINLWLLCVTTFQLLCATTQEIQSKRWFLTDLKQ